MEDRFKLDFKNKVNRIDFNYRGTPGYYDSSPSSIDQEIGYNGKVCKFIPASKLKQDSTDFFTENDIDLLITLRDEFNIEAFPFKKNDGSVTYLFLHGNWLFDVATRLLLLIESARMFNIVGSTLYIDGVEFDYRSKCSFGMSEYGEYSYGILNKVDIKQPIFLSKDTNSGCKISYLKCYLTMLPLLSKEYRLIFEKGYYLDHNQLEVCSKELSKVPINEVYEYKVFDTKDGYNKVVEFVIKPIK